MSIIRSRAVRAAVLATTLTIVAVAPTAGADTTLTATRSGGIGVDAGTTAGKWKFTVTAVTGKPAQVNVRIESADGSRLAFAGDHPKVGQTFESWRVVPEGVYRLRATVWGGPIGDNDSVTLSVDAP